MYEYFLVLSSSMMRDGQKEIKAKQEEMRGRKGWQIGSQGACGGRLIGERQRSGLLEKRDRQINPGLKMS